VGGFELRAVSATRESSFVMAAIVQTSSQAPGDTPFVAPLYLHGAIGNLEVESS
jgi:hypothetical protein